MSTVRLIFGCCAFRTLPASVDVDVIYRKRCSVATPSVRVACLTSVVREILLLQLLLVHDSLVMVYFLVPELIRQLISDRAEHDTVV